MNDNSTIDLVSSQTAALVDAKFALMNALAFIEAVDETCDANTMIDDNLIVTAHLTHRQIERQIKDLRDTLNNVNDALNIRTIQS